MNEQAGKGVFRLSRRAKVFHMHVGRATFIDEVENGQLILCALG